MADAQPCIRERNGITCFHPNWNQEVLILLIPVSGLVRGSGGVIRRHVLQLLKVLPHRAAYGQVHEAHLSIGLIQHLSAVHLASLSIEV